MFNLQYIKDANEIRLVGTNDQRDYEAVIVIRLNSQTKSDKCQVVHCDKTAFNTIFDKNDRFILSECTKELFRKRCNILFDTLLKENTSAANKYTAIAVIDLVSRMCSRVCTKPIGMNDDLVKGWFSDWYNEAELYKIIVKKLVSLCE